MSWLLRDGDVLAATDRTDKGWLLSLSGAVVLPSPALVSTLRYPVALDVAWCARLDPDRGRHQPPGPGAVNPEGPALVVTRIRPVKARRMAPPLMKSGALIVAPAGSFERWQLRVGDHLEVREV